MKLSSDVKAGLNIYVNNEDKNLKDVTVTYIVPILVNVKFNDYVKGCILAKQLKWQ